MEISWCDYSANSCFDLCNLENHTYVTTLSTFTYWKFMLVLVQLQTVPTRQCISLHIIYNKHKLKHLFTLTLWPPWAATFSVLWVWELFKMTNIENSCSFLFSFKPFRLDNAYHCTLFLIKHKLKCLFTLATFVVHFSCFLDMGAISNDKYWKFKLDMVILNLMLIWKPRI